MSLKNAVEEKDLFFSLDGSVGDFAVLLGTALSLRLAAVMNYCHHSYLFCKLRGTLHLLQSEHTIELLLSSWALLIGLFVKLARFLSHWHIKNSPLADE